MTKEKGVSAYRFLEVAKESNDPTLFYAVYKFFHVEKKLSIADAIYDDHFCSIFSEPDDDNNDEDDAHNHHNNNQNHISNSHHSKEEE